jgi:hypothetical protein
VQKSSIEQDIIVCCGVWLRSFDDRLLSAADSTGTCISGAKCMQIITTRDCVAMGDDVDAPHEQQYSFQDSTSIEQAIDQIVNSGYLARVQGGATWSVVSGVPVSVVAQSWDQSRPVSRQPQEFNALKVEDGSIRLHFNYHAQIDPEIVLEVLKRLKFLNTR